MKPLYTGRHTGKPRDLSRSKESASHPRKERLAAINGRTAKKIAFWVGIFACLAVSLAVIVGLVQGYYEMGHPPDGWCQDNSAKCVKP
ncbi:hypothetical protein FCH28_30405 [Streptomyces piniterrae]|uniref:Uncharacterized protein n=1 Tax=Streptomyces piniterrae TaxID=2571125 RepID=A0A4U0MVL1_9ACTN|nr:hypothetical protein [Streptomyces piniterrae]TJZ44622.1 hypothetical protein FCH28_30405 [Streptomyces piniterrae]